MAITGNTPVTPMSPYNERLASLPAVPRKTTPGDGTEPIPSQQPAPQPTADERAAMPIAPPPGKTLADATPTVKFTVIEQLIRSQDPLARNRFAIDTHFSRVRSGVPFSRLEKIPNQSVWVAKLPNGMSKESSAAVPNKADDLCNKLEDQLMADPAKPDPSPRVTDESVREAADLASQFLLQDGGESGTNDAQTYRWALNNAFSRSASILHYVVDQTGGGQQPLQKLAHPQAQDAANPLMGPDGLPATDPIMRYVSAPTPELPAGRFVEQASDADRVWLPKIRIERYKREAVRCFPPTATVEDAKAIAFIRFCTLADARSLWPDTVGQMSADELSALAGWKPAMSELVVPYAFKAVAETGSSGPSLEEVGSLSPLLQRRMYSYRFYVGGTPEYPAGHWVDVNGANGGQVLGEGDLQYTVKLPGKGGKDTRCRDIPAVSVRPREDVISGDPLGFPLIERFAGGSEADGTLIAAFMDVCDNMLHPHVFIPSTTAVNEDEWFDRSLPTVIDPESKGPFYEQFPTLPPILPLSADLNKRMDTISGLTATAQGLDTANTDSGVKANTEIRQALIFLSGFQQNLHAAQTRGWRIKAQLVQAYFSTPQLMEYSGESNSSEERWWTGEDFAGVDRVGIQPGTGSMMTPEGKAQYVGFLQQQGWLPPDQAAEVALPSVRMDLGLPTDPSVAALEREVTAWLEGPPEEPLPNGMSWVDAQRQYLQQKVAYDQQQMQQQVAQQQQALGQDAGNQQAIADHAAQSQNAHAIEQKKAETDIDLSAEERKAHLTLQMEEAKHRMAMEQKQADAEIAERSKPEPSHQPGQLGTPPTVVVSPPDLSGIAAMMEKLTEMIAALASKEHAAPVIHVAVPEQKPADIHVHPVQHAPVVHMPQPPAPVVHVEAPKHHEEKTPPKKRKRKGKVTGPDGKTYMIESEDTD